MIGNIGTSTRISLSKAPVRDESDGTAFCRDVQGYYFSKPVGADAMMALLRKGRFRPTRPTVLLEALAG